LPLLPDEPLSPPPLRHIAITDYAIARPIAAGWLSPIIFSFD
jgi:hypothetical protein